MVDRRRILHSHAAVAAILILTGIAQEVHAQPPPNIVVVVSDDHGWPFYGFMQRWLAHGLDLDGNPDPRLLGNPDAVRNGAEKLRGTGYHEHRMLIPEDTSPATPPVDQIITPALDWLASHGSYFPFAYNTGSVCKPSLATILTGLHVGDYRNAPGGGAGGESGSLVTSPVLAEWLPSFADQQGCVAGGSPACGTLQPDTYLTLAAGKWQYGSVHADDDGAQFPHKVPFDRKLPRSDPQAAARSREALGTAANPLGPVKDFIACATCASADPASQCAALAQSETLDSERLRHHLAGYAQGSCQPQPFFALLAPSIPHLGYRYETFCPYFPRDASECAEPAMQQHSRYCQGAWAAQNVCTGEEFFVRDSLEAIATNLAASAQGGSAADAFGRKIGRTGANGVRGLDGDRRNYFQWVNTLDRAVDELLVYLHETPGPGGAPLIENTVILVITDNGFALPRAKFHYGDAGLRTAVIYYDGRPGVAPVAPESACDGGLPGCRREFVHGVDVLETLRDLTGTSEASCPPEAVPCASGGSGGGCCPAEPPGYDLGRSLAQPWATLRRPCRTSEVVDGDGEPVFDANGCRLDQPGICYRQCLPARKAQSGQSVSPEDAWFMLTEITEEVGGGNPPRTHRCKIYREGCRPSQSSTRLFNLNADPGERNDEMGDDETFCGSQQLGKNVSILDRLLLKEILTNEWAPPTCGLS